MKTKTYVITGSTSGIGKALIEKLSDNNIVFAGYRKKNSEDELHKISSNIYPFYIDYAKPETIKLASDYILSKCTKIDTLVNIAGAVVAGPIERIEISELKKQFDVNTFGHLEFSRNLLDVLNGGKIINISSMASYGVFPFIAPYCASKKCLDMLFNSLLLETKKNIKIISVKPGVISTPLWEKSIQENSKHFNISQEYEKEMQFLIANAKKNSTKGLNVEKVVNKIIQIDNTKKPKLSYNIGFDAICVSILSKLPQKYVNFGIKYLMKYRIKR